MTKRISVDLQTAIAKATELVKDLPPDLRQVAFAKAFDALTALDGSSGVSPPSGGAKSAPRQQNKVADETVTKSLLEALDSTNHPEIVDGKQARDLALWVLKAARDTAKVEWLTPAIICAILREKFRISVKVNAVTMALSRAGKFVDRRKQNDVYVYRIMSAGETLLSSSDSTHSSVKRTSPEATFAKKSPTDSRAAAKKRAAGLGAKRASGGARTRAPHAAGRLGPKAMLEALIASGYFMERRTIGDIIAHVEVKQARKVKATDLSPALGRLQREQKIDRDRNAQGQYEYTRHSKHT